MPSGYRRNQTGNELFDMGIQQVLGTYEEHMWRDGNRRLVHNRRDGGILIVQ